MHDVIGPMWHDAFPARDTRALAKMLPSIERHAAAVSRAELPGVLRDKRNQWGAGVSNLQSAVSDYRAAVKDGSSDAILIAAEALHAQYEALGRVIRLPVPELEPVHAAIYVIYHYQVNPLQLAKVASGAPELRAHMDALNQAQLPEDLQAKKPAFAAQRERLSRSVDALLALIPSKDEARIVEAIELMHIEYVKLVDSIER